MTLPRFMVLSQTKNWWEKRLRRANIRCGLEIPKVCLRALPEARAANLTLFDLLKRMAERKDATPAQIALAWLLAQKPWIVPIPGTTKLERLRENLASIELIFSAPELSALERAISNIQLQGDRYPAEQQKQAQR